MRKREEIQAKEMLEENTHAFRETYFRIGPYNIPSSVKGLSIRVARDDNGR